jgi:hypothetical protein
VVKRLRHVLLFYSDEPSSNPQKRPQLRPEYRNNQINPRIIYPPFRIVGGQCQETITTWTATFVGGRDKTKPRRGCILIQMACYTMVTLYYQKKVARKRWEHKLAYLGSWTIRVPSSIRLVCYRVFAIRNTACQRCSEILNEYTYNRHTRSNKPATRA